MPSSPIDMVQDDESVPPAVPVAASRRWWVIVGGAFTVAAVLIAATGLPFDRAQTPAVPGPAETGPVETGPTVAPDDRPDDYTFRIPPAGTAVSTPVEGKLIAEAYVGFGGQVWVYADGRVLRLSKSFERTTYVEQRLSPEGVELVRQVLGERVHLGDGPGAVRLEILLGIWSRQSAWEDREGKPYVPARYGACFRRTDSPPDLEALLDLLPASAQALLRGSDPGWNSRCLVVTTEEARSLEEILSEARSSLGGGPLKAGAWSLRDGTGDQFISLHPLFPDGRKLFQTGGGF
jgi:hypothetical protein